MTGVALTVPGGDPAALRQLAAQLRTAAQGSGNLGANTSDLAAAITSDAQWTGAASSSFSAFSANLSQGTSAAEAPLTRIADAVENYANVLDVAQQKAQAATVVAHLAESDPTGSLMSTTEQYGLSAMDALDALQQAGDQAAEQINSAADDLQVNSLFGPQGRVTSWADSQPGQTEIFPVDDGLDTGTETIPADDGLGPWIETIPADDGLGPWIETIPVDDGLGPPVETIPEEPQGPLVNYDTDLPRLDGSGKLHMPDREDPLPGYVPPDWTGEDLEQVESDLQESIRNRQAEMVRLGENTPSGPAHRARINEEIQLLRQVQKKLSGS